MKFLVLMQLKAKQDEERRELNQLKNDIKSQLQMEKEVSTIGMHFKASSDCEPIEFSPKYSKFSKFELFNFLVAEIGSSLV